MTYQEGLRVEGVAPGKGYIEGLRKRPDYKFFLRDYGLDKDKKEEKALFLAAYRDFKTLTHTAEAIGWSRRQIGRWKEKDPAFKVACEEVEKIARDDLQFIIDSVVAGKMEVSPMRSNMIMFRMKAIDPSYKDKYIAEVTVTDELVKLFEKLHELNKK